MTPFQTTVLPSTRLYQTPEIISTRVDLNVTDEVGVMLDDEAGFAEIIALVSISNGHSAVTMDFSAAGTAGSHEFNTEATIQLERLNDLQKAIEAAIEGYVTHLATLAFPEVSE
jgi:hypothetical protein